MPRGKSFQIVNNDTQEVLHPGMSVKWYAVDFAAAMIKQGHNAVVVLDGKVDESAMADLIKRHGSVTALDPEIEALKELEAAAKALRTGKKKGGDIEALRHDMQLSMDKYYALLEQEEA